MLTIGTTRIESFANTDVGLVRSQNEDSFLLFIPQDQWLLEEKGIMAIVADGVGGNVCGKIASSMAVSVMWERYYASEIADPLSALKESMITANREIITKASQDPSCHGMATTCAAFVLRGNKGYISNAGDSRVYLLRGSVLQQITNDHTLVNSLLSDGLISAEDAAVHPQKNVLVKAVGSRREIAPDTFQISLEKDDAILLCSDGLHGLVSDNDIKKQLLSLSAQEAGQSLINLAKGKGGTDNISVIIIKLSCSDGIMDEDTKPFLSQTYNDLPSSKRREINSVEINKKKLRIIYAVIGSILAALLLGSLSLLLK
jgi:PPM family protein phosphatase